MCVFLCVTMYLCGFNAIILMKRIQKSFFINLQNERVKIIQFDLLVLIKHLRAW